MSDIKASSIEKSGINTGKTAIALKPLLVCTYTLKALQNSKHINDLTWDTTGNEANYNANGAITLDCWNRHGISCCASGDSATKMFIVGDYAPIVKDKKGNKNFKAVMIKGAFKAEVPGYTTANIMVSMAPSLCKCGGDTSSTWIGGLVSDTTSWKTVKDDYHTPGQWATPENSGVLVVESGERFVVIQNDDEDYWEKNLGVLNYNAGNIVNDGADSMSLDAAPVYIVSTVEKASTINQRLLVHDFIPGYNVIDADVVYRSEILYDGEGMDAENQTYVFSYKQPAAVRFRSVTRFGYRQTGWLEETTGRFYPATCYFSEERGIKLSAQWAAVSTTYTVEHYLQKPDGSYSDTPDGTMIHRNLTGSAAVVPAKEYAGYGEPKCEQADVLGDGSTVVKCYYPLLEYPIEFCANGGTFKDGGDFRTSSILYSQRVMAYYPELEEREGYILDHWEPELPTFMPAKKFTTRAVWVKNTNYYIDYQGEGATGGQMQRQTLELNQSEKLEANTYVRQYTVKFMLDGLQQIESKTVEYHFEGWAETSGGAKVYDDEATVCNLTNTVGATVNLYAVWSPESITLPQMQWEDRYLDGWYKDPECTKKVGSAGECYTPTENVTLYAQTISKEIEGISWYQDTKEPVEERRIYARWNKGSKIKSYLVGLSCDDQAVCFGKDTLPDGVSLKDDGRILVTAGTDETEEWVTVDMTEIFKQNTDGGKYQFTVQPQIDDVETVARKSPEITALAAIHNPGWDETRTIAMWDSVEGADYYLVWVYSEGVNLAKATGTDISDYCDLDSYGDSGYCVQVEDAEANLSGVIAELSLIQYEVVGYSNNTKDYYTPKYEHIKSEIA